MPWASECPDGIDSHWTRCSTAAYRPQTPERRVKQLSRRSSKKAERVVRHTLADGTERTYTYAAYKPRRARVSGDTLGHLIAAWERSPEWSALAANTQAGYLTYLKPLMGMQHVQTSRIERRELIDIRNAHRGRQG